MNVIWSKYVQGTKTLYYSRRLRFDDLFAEQYKALFALEADKPIKILEAGCGPGAFAGALHRWYPNAEITAVDRDSEFIRFAKEHESGAFFMESDVTALPFEDNTFDVTISNTVAEHIEPSVFYGEQRRVLKPGGVCLVLSSRKGISVEPDCIAPNEFERQFWNRVRQYDDSLEKYAVCQYPMNEAGLPAAMEKYGFSDISIGFVTIDLTPDNPRFSPALAHAMIEAHRQSALEGIQSVLDSMPEHFSDREIDEMKGLANAKFDVRVRQYDRGEKQWDTNVSIIMVVRGMKRQ